MDAQAILVALGEGMDRPEILAVLGLTAISFVFWRVPVIGWFFYPFRLFVTFVHEIAHGLAALITGGKFQRFVVRQNLNGEALVSGGQMLLIAHAGYLGTSLFGAVLVVLAGRDVNPGGVLVGLGIGLALMCLLWVRNSFGMLAGLLLGAGLAYAGTQLNDTQSSALLLFLAVQTSLQALHGLWVLITLSGSRLPTDAHRVGAITGLPALFWALSWTLFSVALLYFALRYAYRLPPPNLQLSWTLNLSIWF